MPLPGSPPDVRASDVRAPDVHAPDVRAPDVSSDEGGDAPPRALARRLRASRPGATTPVDALAPLISRALTAARATWPDVPVDGAALIDHVARGLDEGEDEARALEQLHAADLHLALASGRGDPLALGHLEREFLRPLLATLARVPACQDESARVEVVQRLRERLLLRDPQRARAPGILAYAGRGPLSAWLRVVAVREALGLQRRHRRERPTEADQLDALHDAAAGPELALLKQRSREAFREAFHDAVASLTPSERTLLRHYYLHGMGIDPLARILQIHRATVARRLARLRDTLLERTRERLRVTLGMQPEEFASVVRLIASRFDASVRRALGPDDDDQEPGDQVPHSS